MRKEKLALDAMLIRAGVDTLEGYDEETIDDI